MVKCGAAAGHGALTRPPKSRMRSSSHGFVREFPFTFCVIYNYYFFIFGLHYLATNLEGARDVFILLAAGFVASVPIPSLQSELGVFVGGSTSISASYGFNSLRRDLRTFLLGASTWEGGDSTLVNLYTTSRSRGICTGDLPLASELLRL